MCDTRDMTEKLSIPISKEELIHIEQHKAQLERERLLIINKAKERKARKARRRRIGKNIARIELNHNIGVLIPYNNARSEKMIKAERKKVVAALTEGMTVHPVVLEYHGLTQE